MKQQATKGCARSLDGEKIKQTSYSRGSMDFNDEVRPVYDITKAKQLLVPQAQGRTISLHDCGKQLDMKSVSKLFPYHSG